MLLRINDLVASGAATWPSSVCTQKTVKFAFVFLSLHTDYLVCVDVHAFTFAQKILSLRSFLLSLHTKNQVCVWFFKFAHKKLRLRSCF